MVLGHHWHFKSELLMICLIVLLADQGELV